MVVVQEGAICIQDAAEFLLYLLDGVHEECAPRSLFPVAISELPLLLLKGRRGLKGKQFKSTRSKRSQREKMIVEFGRVEISTRVFQ